MRSIFVSQQAGTVRSVYSEETTKRLGEKFGLETDRVYTKEQILADPASFSDVTYVFSTWGMPSFTEDQIRAAFGRNLMAVFYAAGSVQGFARPFLNCGVRVFSAWAANGVPVAEVTVAEIILANKGMPMAARLCSRNPESRGESIRYVRGTRGNYGARVGIIGVGMIGSMVCEMLKNYRLEVVAYDPFCPPEKAAALGVKLVSLPELFATSDVISNHLANNAQTRGMLDYALFSSMKPFAVFINTGRGAQVVEADLVRALREETGRCAILDVTDPEPAPAGSPWYELPNVILTPHLAGSQNDEWHRMSEYMADEADAFDAGLPTRYSVSLKMLETMA
ncbi:MAG: hydroxyacid dehydrogenase [Clostridia bacterium]|nr:hydroxyacid dehydrogenase [Clostridia bacterium]